VREQKANILDMPVMRLEPERPVPAAALGVPAGPAGGEISALVAALRRHIARIEQALPDTGRRDRPRSEPWTTGVAVIDRHLAATGLARVGLHDVAPAAYGDMPAAMGFALALALRRLADPAERRPFLWCRLAREEREYGRLYGHGLERLGLARRRFVTVTLKKPATLLWVMEEALKSGALAAVAGDADPARTGLTATRRLGLAARTGKSAGLLVFTAPAPGATASHTRWTAAAAPSRAPPDDALAPGAPAWRVELTRARGGRPGAWTVEWHHAPHRFDLVSGLSGGALHPWTDEIAAPRPAERHALRAG
jgi:protein ImuA